MEKEHESFVLVGFQGNDQKIVREWYPIQEITCSYEIKKTIQISYYIGHNIVYTLKINTFKTQILKTKTKTRKKNLEV